MVGKESWRKRSPCLDIRTGPINEELEHEHRWFLEE
jgi:hypothetical protein